MRSDGYSDNLLFFCECSRDTISSNIRGDEECWFRNPQRFIDGIRSPITEYASITPSPWRCNWRCCIKCHHSRTTRAPAPTWVAFSPRKRGCKFPDTLQIHSSCNQAPCPLLVGSVRVHRIQTIYLCRHQRRHRQIYDPLQ